MTTERLKQLQENVTKAQREEMQELRAKEENQKVQERLAAYQESLSKFKQKRVSSKSRDGQALSDWDASTNAAKESGNTTAFNSEWKIAMLGLVDNLMLLNKAMSNSVKQTLMSLNAPGFISKEPIPLGFILNEGIRSLLKGAPKDANPLPILLHGVTLNDENALEVNITRKADVEFKKQTQNGASAYDFNAAFKEVVIEWLAENGYQPSPDPAQKGQFVNSAGELLTKEALDNLKNDPDKGLNHYLKSNSDLEFEERPGMRP